jgi:DNA-binding beta-propeller fold protein YncE
MSRRLGVVAFGVALVIAGALPVTVAAAGGLAIPGYTGAGEVAAPGGDEHYVAHQKRDGSTVVRALGQTGSALRSTTVSGRFVIPAVALDGSPGGLSADETALVLIQPRQCFPQSETHLAILDAQSLALRERLTLHGDFSFDAISPDGSHIYLIEYLAPNDPTKYAVRAYDAIAGSLLPEPIVDPDEPGDEMRGYPVTRVTSPDGRWAYTLYDGGGKYPFVHALDTLEGRAVCIDLPAFAHHGAYNSQLRVNSDGGLLTLARKREPVAVIDTETFSVSRPSAAPSAGQEADSEDGGMAWSLIASAAVVTLVAVGGLTTLHRRRGRRFAAGDVR